MKNNSSIYVEIRTFFKERVKRILVYILFSGIFFLLFKLQDVPTDVVLYAAEICAFLTIIFWSIEFFHFHKKHRQLLELKNTIGFSMETIPEVDSLIEREYHEILEKQFSSLKTQEVDFFRQRQEMMDYYTLWAHQIKTPITALSLILQSRSEADFDYIQMKQELFKIEQYVELVMEYLRLNSMNTDLVLEQYSLEKIVKQSVKKYATVFMYKGLSLKLENISVEVLTDEKWLCFVICQLLSNALKYTKEGSIRIYLSEQSEKSLVIEDTGIGINKKDLPRVFEQGFTGYNGRMDKKASGLGLYLSKKVMTNLGHNILIESVEGKGTKVILDLKSEGLEVE